jgi:hypothetical protein
MPRVFLLPILWLALFFPAHPLQAAQPPASDPPRWWKGNLHTHSFWSDGDDFPEMIVDWYKTNGYHFLALSDHNIVLKGTKWIHVATAARRLALTNYLARFGQGWVETRTLQSTQQVRLKTLQQFRRRFEQPDRFLLIPSEEISDKYRLLPLHLNATNLRRLIKPQGGTSVVDVLQRNIDAINAQRRWYNLPIVPHVNHPNFGWAITAEELMQVRGDKLFEVYNGHPQIHNQGDVHHASVERTWDIILAFRLSQLGLDPLYGLAVDDSHNYHNLARTNSNPGRGWVVVRAPRLRVADLVAALEAGDFYASTGVRLKDLRRTSTELSLEIDPEAGVTYTTQFIGTLRGFDPTSRRGPRPTNSIYAVTRLYTEEIGAVLGEVKGERASYRLQGDELYVRAKVISSKPKINAYAADETEAAWVQPVVPRKPVNPD